jgi:hypothetical protein
LIHSIAALAAIRIGLSGLIAGTGSSRVSVGAKAPFASCQRSKNLVMSVARSLMTGRFSNGPISSRRCSATFATWVRQVQRGRPLTVMAHDPHMPTRQAKRYASVESRCRCT